MDPHQMSYTIERGIPIPADAGRRGPGRPPGPLRQALERLEVGESILLTERHDYDNCRSHLNLMRPKTFIQRKVPHEGWRVWRVA